MNITIINNTFGDTTYVLITGSNGAGSIPTQLTGQENAFLNGVIWVQDAVLSGSNTMVTVASNTMSITGDPTTASSGSMYYGGGYCMYIVDVVLQQGAQILHRPQ